MSQTANDATLDDDLVSELALLDLNSPEYSHDVAVRAITSFYEFVDRMHPRELASIEYPPPTGWPEITHETFVLLPAAVIQLLRHIPYLRGCPCIMADTEPIDYTDQQVGPHHEHYASSLEQDEDDYENDPNNDVPAQIVILASGVYRYGYDILLDTQRGVIYWVVKDGDHMPIDLPPGDAKCFEQDGVEHPWGSWKTMPTYRIATFFEMCTEQFSILN